MRNTPRGRRSGWGIAVVALLVLVLGAASAEAVPNRQMVTRRASVDTGGGDPDGESQDPSISADGRYVAFYSYASDLVPGDGNGNPDVFVRDLVAGTTERVSVNTDGGDPNDFSASPSISADGRHVAFTSWASDLVAGDGNGLHDIFVRDLVAGTTVRASVDTGGGDPNSYSFQPSISADGRYVAFSSLASDLVAGDGNAIDDIFVRDVLTGTTVRASVDTGGGDANGYSDESSISADGRYVAFTSYASDLVKGDGNNTFDVFVRDLVVQATERVSVDTGGGDPDSDSYDPSISADGRYVAFYSYASDLVAGDGNGSPDIFVRDLVAGTTERVSVNTDGGDPNYWSFRPSISADGRYVAFYSYASDLVARDGNGLPDIFVRDLVARTTERVSVDTGGGDPDGESSDPSISADGQYVAFWSFAGDLVPHDDNAFADVFIRAQSRRH